MHKIHLIPIHVNSYTSLLDVSTNYILTNSEDHFIELSRQKLSEYCKKCTSGEHKTIRVCNQNKPKTIDPHKSSCLAKLFFDKVTDSRHCKHKFVPQALDTLTKFEQRNTWLFVFDKPHKIFSHCDKTTSLKVLTGTGIISLTKQCTYTLENLELPFEGEREIHMPIRQPTQDLSPNFKIFITNTSTTKDFSFEVTIRPYQSNQLKLLEQGKTIEELEKDINIEAQRRKVQKQLTHTYTNSTVISLITITLVIGILIKFKVGTKICCLTPCRTKRNRSIQIEGNRTQHTNAKDAKSEETDRQGNVESLEMRVIAPTKNTPSTPQLKLNKETIPHNVIRF